MSVRSFLCSLTLSWLLSSGGEVEAQADTPLDLPEPLVLGAENAGG